MKKYFLKKNKNIIKNYNINNGDAKKKTILCKIIFFKVNINIFYYTKYPANALAQAKNCALCVVKLIFNF